MWRDPFCLQQSNSALHIAGCHYVVDSLILSVCTSLCFIHRQPTYERGAGANGERTHARTRARNPFKDENEPWRGEERERERERDSLGLCLPSSAHPLPFDEDFNLACTRLRQRRTDHLTSVSLALRT